MGFIVAQDISEVLLKFEEMVVVTIASRDDVADLLRYNLFAMLVIGWSPSHTQI